MLDPDDVRFVPFVTNRPKRSALGSSSGPPLACSLQSGYCRQLCTIAQTNVAWLGIITICRVRQRCHRSPNKPARFLSPSYVQRSERKSAASILAVRWTKRDFAADQGRSANRHTVLVFLATRISVKTISAGLLLSHFGPVAKRALPLKPGAKGAGRRISVG